MSYSTRYNPVPITNVFVRYTLAEKLTDRLNELNKDLTSMIENINDASSSLIKNTKSDDPVRYLFP